MANLTTTSDLVSAALSHAGELTDGNSPYAAKALEYVNRVFMEVVAGGSTFVPELAEPWPWAKAQSPGVLALEPAYVTGTVTLTQGSVSGSFSDAPAVGLGSFAGRFLIMTDRADVYRVAAHTAGASAFTLDLAYAEASGALTFAAHRLDYPLSSGIIHLVEPFRIFRTQTWEGADEGRVEGIGPDELARTYPLHRLETGIPTKFSISGEASGVLKIRINRSPSEAMRVEYEHISIPSDLTVSPDTTPIVPREHRSVLALGATYWLMLDKEDSRADAFFRMTQAKIQAMLQERRREGQSTGRNFGKVIARGDMREWRYRLTSTSGMRF